MKSFRPQVYVVSGIALVITVALLIYSGKGDLLPPSGSSSASLRSGMFSADSDSDSTAQISEPTIEPTIEPSSAAPTSGNTPKPTAGQAKTAVPSWYAPGRLSLLTLTHPNPSLATRDPLPSAASGTVRRLSFAQTAPAITRLSSAAVQSRSLSLPAGAVADPNRTRWADYVTLSSVKAYPDEDGLYFYMPDSRIIRFSYEAKAALAKASKIPSGGYIQLLYSDPSTGHAIIEVRSAAHVSTGAFYFNYNTKRTAALPLEVVNSTFTVSPNGHMLAMTITNSNSRSELVMLDLSQASPVLISITDGTGDSFKPSERFFFTDSGKYLVYGTADDTGRFFDDGNTPFLAVYNIAKRSAVRVSGHFVRSIRDDAYLVLEIGGKGIVVRSDTGVDVTGSVTLEAWESMRIQIGSVKIKGGAYRQTASEVSLFGFDSPALSYKEAGAAYASGPYLYIYNTGSDAILCLHIGTGSSFKVPVDAGFVNEVKGLKAKGLEATFYFSLSRDRTSLLLQYTASRYQDEEAFGPYYMNDGFWRAFLQSEDLQDLKDYVEGGKNLKLGEDFESNPYENTKRFYIVEGDGYTSLIAVSETDFKVAVEDYRDRTFTLYRAVNTEAWFAPPSLYDVTGDDPSIPTSSFRKRLPSSASAQTSRGLYADLTKLEPYYDYADFYRSGVLDPEKIRLWQLRPELADYEVSAHAGIADVDSQVDGAVFGYPIYDREPLAELFAEIVALSGFRLISDQFNGTARFPAIGSSYWTGKECMEYMVSLDADRRLSSRRIGVYEMNLGMNIEGRYYLYTHAGYCYLTKAQHDRLAALCKVIHEAAAANS
ncbi:MAG: hypothetical protein ACYCYM_14855 [Saccharofermentanales bacterium]